MSDSTTGLTLAFAPRNQNDPDDPNDPPVDFGAPELDEPFNLVTDDGDQGGSAPVQLETSSTSTAYHYYEWGSHKLSVDWVTALKVLVPGKKRIKLYCSSRVAGTVRLMVGIGESPVQQSRSSFQPPGNAGSQSQPAYDAPDAARLIGRRSEMITETLSWLRENDQKLQYFYDNPTVEIIEQTSFWDANGNKVDTPRYDRARGTFRSSVKVVGMLVVRYNAGFSLFEITYGNGESVASPTLFAEMQKAWKSGDIYTTDIPPVRIIALSRWHAAMATFQRKFWPIGDTRFFFSNARLDEDDSSISTRYSEVPGKRKTVTERVFHPDNSEVFVDVKKTTYLEARDEKGGPTLKLQLIGS